MDRPRFSVAMCVYGKDNPSWFQAAVDSVLNQTAPPDEVVLVVDGPVPEVLESIISEYAKNPIFKVVKLPTNEGHGNARRKSLDACTENLVALMDADDISTPDRFEKQLQMMASGKIDIVGGNISEFIGQPENIVGYRNLPETDAEIKEYMKTRCPFNQVTVMFRKESYLKAGGYIDWHCDEDYYLWLRMAQENMVFANIPEVLVNVRVGEDMYKRRGGAKYFKSEAALQKYMLAKKIITPKTYILNVSKRLIVQVLLPSSIRGWVFKKFARSNNHEKV